MSEENKNVVTTLREKIAARKAMPKIIPVDVAGLGTVRVRRIGGIEAAGFKSGAQAVLATCLDEKDQPLFTSADEVDEDRAIAIAMFGAYVEVNSLDVGQAQKN